MGSSRRAQLTRYPSATGCLEVVARAPALHLQAYVREYSGYTETTSGLLLRREFPGPQIPVIFEFGPPIRIVDNMGKGRSTRHKGGFVAGIDDSPTSTEHDGFQRGLRMNLTPIGARLFLGVPMVELTGRVVAINDLFDAEARCFAQRLGEVEEWDARFDLLDEFITARIERARGDGRVAAWAVGRITAHGGQIDVRALAREAGYSQKHLISLFRDFVGVPPKLLARIVRFDQVMRRLRSGRAGSWGELAAEYGYYDQAHLVRDFRQFAGATPTETRSMLAAVSEAASDR